MDDKPTTDNPVAETMDDAEEDLTQNQGGDDSARFRDPDSGENPEEYDPTDPGISEADILQSIPLGADGVHGIRPDFTFKGHSKQVFSVEILECSGTCGSGSESGSGPGSGGDSLAARIFASGGEDDTLRVWRGTDGDVVSSVGFADSVTWVRANAKKSKLAVASMDGCIKVLGVPDFSQQLLAIDPIGDLECIDWHPNADILIAGTADGQIWMWLVPNSSAQAATGGVPSVKIVPGFGPGISSAGFLPDGKHVLAGYKDGAGRIWDMKTLGPTPLESGQAPVTSHAVSKSGVEACALGYEDGLVGLFHSSGKFLTTFRHENDVEDEGVSTESLDFSPAFPHLASGHLDASIAVWDLNTSARRQTMEHDESVVKVMFHGPHELLSAGLDGTARLWDVRTGTAVKTWVASDGEVLDFAVDDQFLLLGGNQCDLFRIG